MATRSSSLPKRSPRCCASHSRLPPVVMQLSMMSFCMKAGSAIIRPTRPLETCGSGQWCRRRFAGDVKERWHFWRRALQSSAKSKLQNEEQILTPA